MAYVVGKKSDESIIEIHMPSPAWSLEQTQTIFVNKFGGVVGDYSFFEMDNTDVIQVQDQWEHTVVWTANEITDIDWTPETSKRWLKVSCDKTEIENDGVEVAVITLEAWKADLSGIDTNLNGTILMPIVTPFGARSVKVAVTNGVMVKNFKTDKSGSWNFPLVNDRFANVRVFNQVSLNVIESSVW